MLEYCTLTAFVLAQLRAMFVRGELKVLCSTTCLAMGVNLPCHLVVVMGTKQWRGAGKGYTSYSKSTLLQARRLLCNCCIADRACADDRPSWAAWL